MKPMLAAAAAALVAMVAAPAFADPPGGHYDHGRHEGWDRDRGHHDGYVRHGDWRRGHRIDRADWDRGERVDWRRHHLRRPPYGYEWRYVDGNYVLAAVATGLIASIIANSR